MFGLVVGCGEEEEEEESLMGANKDQEIGPAPFLKRHTTNCCVMLSLVVKTGGVKRGRTKIRQ